MKKLILITASVLLTSWAFMSCQKEVSVETGATPTNPGGPLTTVGWQFTDTTGGTNTAYSGCIDTAFYTTINNAPYLRIEGSDNSGNVFYMIITAPNNKASKGVYTAALGQTLIVFVKGTSNYTVNSSDVNFRAEITDITDTTVNASFSGKLVNQTGGSLNITAGKLKALIGKENPCSGSGTGGGTTPAASYTLTSGNTCGGAVVSGTYATNNPASSSEFVTLSVNVTTAGSYSISTVPTNGLTFSASGTFSSTGTQTIILKASGTPTNTGTTTIPVTAGNSNCSFDVTVVQGTATPYGFSFLDSNLNKTFAGIDTAVLHTYQNTQFLSIIGTMDASFNTADTLVSIDIALPTGSIQTGTFSTPANQIFFSMTDQNFATYYYEADPGYVPTSSFTVTITSHDPATKTVIGTFRAIANKDEKSPPELHTLKNGTFKARYQ